MTDQDPPPVFEQPAGEAPLAGHLALIGLGRFDRGAFTRQPGAFAVGRGPVFAARLDEVLHDFGQTIHRWQDAPALLLHVKEQARRLVCSVHLSDQQVIDALMSLARHMALSHSTVMAGLRPPTAVPPSLDSANEARRIGLQSMLRVYELAHQATAGHRSFQAFFAVNDPMIARMRAQPDIATTLDVLALRRIMRALRMLQAAGGR